MRVYATLNPMNTPAFRTALPAVLYGLLLTLSSCSVVGDIFEAGAWTGVIAVLLIIGVIVWLFSKRRSGGNRE